MKGVVSACVLGLGLTACGTDASGALGQAELEAHDADSAWEYAGQVHVELRSGSDREVQVRARFAAYRGLDLEAAEARLGRTGTPELTLDVDTCARMLSREEDGALSPEDVPEIELLDAGDLEVRVGSEAVEVPLGLVPSVLPYLSGVEYASDETELPWLPDAKSLELRTRASGSEVLPDFELSTRLPPALEGTAIADADASDLELHWVPSPADPFVVLRVHDGAGESSEPFACLLRDDGSATISDTALELRDDVTIELVRTRRVLFDAGQFEDAELHVERIERLELTTALADVQES